MHYRSAGDLSSTIARNAWQLPPDTDLVVGVPRSGMLAASLLALHLNLPMTDLDGLFTDRVLTIGRTRTVARPLTSVNEAKAIVVIDDSALSGGTARWIRERLDDHPEIASRVTFAVVYVDPTTPSDHIDLSFETVGFPRMFEWNLMHHPLLEQACVDIDGVLCPDPTDRQNDDGPNYQNFLREAPALRIPSTKIGWLVTSRLERYRTETEAWLSAQGVSYGELIMSPHDTGGARRAAADHAIRKAEAYRRTGASVFIESDPDQADEIAFLTGKPVVCTSTQRVHRGRGPRSLAPRAGTAIRRRLRLLAARLGLLGAVIAIRDRWRRGHQGTTRR